MRYVILLALFYVSPSYCQTITGDSLDAMPATTAPRTNRFPTNASSAASSMSTSQSESMNQLGENEVTNDTIASSGKNMLPNVVVFGHRKDLEAAKAKATKIDMQLIRIQSSDMSFKPLGIIKYVIGLFKKKHKETKREKMERILRDYDKIE